jgi:hypothetical protein
MIESGCSALEAGAAHGVTAATARKWQGRYLAAGEAGNAPCGVASRRADESDRLLVAAAQRHSFTSNTASSPRPSSRDAAFARHPAPICCATSRVT